MAMVRAPRWSFLMFSLVLALGAFAVACHDTSAGLAPSGVIVGSVSSSLGGALSGVSLVVTPTGGKAMALVTSGSTGTFRVIDVPAVTGSGAIAVSGVPVNCTAPSTVGYTGLFADDSVIVPIVVPCVPVTGSITGSITNSLGGGIPGASVTVTPTGGTALAAVVSSSAGAYTVSSVLVGDGAGAVAVSSLPSNCTTPSPTAYSGLTFRGSVTVNITVTCTPLTGTVSGTVTSSLGGGIANANVTVTPSAGSAAPAVTTSGTGAYAVTVPVGAGSGSVAVSSLPTNCTAPSPVAYSGLTSGKTVTANVTVTCTPITGNLTITVNAPNGSTPSVSVTGPSGYTRNLSATQTLTALTPGSYSVTASIIVGGVCLSMYRDTALVTGSPATVASNATASVTVTYVPEPTGMWVADATGADEYAQFTPTQLVSSGAQTPANVITGASPGGTPINIAFDRSGNLWSVDGQTNTLKEYAAASLGTPGATPIGSLTYSGLNYVKGLAFDANGNMWLANYGPCQIDEYSAAQLSGLSGAATVTPALVLNSCLFDGTLSGPSALAFDFSGNLWVVDTDNSQVYMYSAASLATSGTANVEPVVRLHTTDNMVGQYLAFDDSGNLWVTSGSSRVIEFSSSQLGTTATVTPAVTITASGAQFEGLGFDTNRNLWVADAAANGVDEFTMSQLATGGSLTPNIAVGTANGSAANQPWTLAFYPHSEFLPLYNRAGRRVGSARR
jgi:sugar lactone lactonase YvrE